MNKLITKIAALSVGLALAVGVGVAASQKAPLRVKAESSSVSIAERAETLKWSNGTAYSGWTDASGIFTFTASSDNGKYYSSNSSWRVYSGGTATITCSSDYSITAITSDPSVAFTISPEGTSASYSFTSKVEFKTFDITYSASRGPATSITVSGSMTKTEYKVGESWNPAGLTVLASYESGDPADVTAFVEWSYSPSAPALGVTSVVATATYGQQSDDSVAQAVTVIRENKIQSIYSKSGGASVDVYGYYAGFLTGTGPVIMDGEYGVVIYKSDASVTGYNENTVLHVTGVLSIYNGLYEISSNKTTSLVITDVTESVSEANKPASPVVYSVKGGETEEFASRLTTVTGVVKSVATRLEGKTLWTDDTNVYVTVNGVDILCFCKAGALSAADGAKVEAAVGGTAITFKGFTGWFKGFQVTVNGLVEAKEDYTAEQFAQDLLDQTDAVCEGWTEGKNNHDALEAIWTDLASAEKYPSLPQAQKDILAAAERNESGTVVERAMYRYDFLTGKYSLSNFINGRTPIVSAKGELTADYSLQNANSVLAIVVATSVLSAVAFTLVAVLKKKKHN